MTLEDNNIFGKIYGHNISALKGKTTQSKPEPVVTDYIKVPKEINKANNNITISGDILFVNKINFFETIIRSINFTTTKCIRNRTLKQMFHSMGTVK